MAFAPHVCPQPQALIFDMDGVLCDTMAYHVRAWDTYIQCTPALAGVDWAKLHTMGGKRNCELLPELLGRPVSQAEVDELGRSKDAIFRELITPELMGLAGVLEFLKSAKASGLKLGLGTSASQENVDLIMAWENMGDFFPVRVTEVDVQRGKPDPQCYLLVAERLGVEPKDCLVFEDAVAGVEAAWRAGMACWGVLTLHSAAELIEKGAAVCIQDFTDARLGELLPLAQACV
ncbi:HAD family phosphatase [Synechococcus sp. PCC 6312]|uniref:HAD family hydrolase n=1 Tax=Synechococcus sp. (strain ATCC 27167 / PCC 6312) TaxID=195253 RepID=UPI00029F0454|nr:HAD-IA family hydrolase [Synechococcus sp. PCC 6312]AFY61717.1 haloacid dehalogenase superfamily protein, subfamily IA, variant 3 with third motif having DD or ED [Synechococcus sp. PCC 6312]